MTSEGSEPAGEGSGEECGRVTFSKPAQLSTRNL